MKKIDISTKKNPNIFTLVDDEDYGWLSKYRWHAVKYITKYKTYYYASRAGTEGEPSTVKMHRQILNIPHGMLGDHRNGHTLDNRRQNLRQCTRAQNAMNQGLRTTSKSGYKGVVWDKDVNMWRPSVRHERHLYHLGCFTCLIKAAKAYDKKATELFGEFAKTNFN